MGECSALQEALSAFTGSRRRGGALCPCVGRRAAGRPSQRAAPGWRKGNRVPCLLGLLQAGPGAEDGRPRLLSAPPGCPSIGFCNTQSMRGWGGADETTAPHKSVWHLEGTVGGRRSWGPLVDERARCLGERAPKRPTLKGRALLT